ncbi:DUF2750 domain-containing protein [Thalassotalea sp. PLHSN55]|uniref:DUF2750 domain-containing protein n=1 Tax=Thalassotalea sp. PLHSN55 TaxID=3435888 RepID=UPI003F868335
MFDKTIVDNFLADVKPSQTLWALQDKTSEDWVVLDSINFENSEVMPLWSSAELAQQHCVDEWKNYQPSEISLAEWFEFWLEDLNEDNVIVGINWQEDDNCVEMELSDFSQALAAIESLK